MVFVVDCGATTTNNERWHRVSILGANESLSDFAAGNVFGVGPNEQVRNPRIQVSWMGENELTIRYPARAKVSEKVSKYKGITINYVAVVGIP